MPVSVKIEMELLSLLTNNEPERKKVKIGEIIAKMHVIRMMALINPVVFPSGSRQVRMADNKIIPVMDNKY